MLAKRILSNGTIGIFSPCHVPDTVRYELSFYGLKTMGLSYKLGENFSKDTWGYTASAQERADDLNTLVADPEVDAILFNGGNGAAEILPYIDYAAIKANPKRIGSYSDGTSILNAIHGQTGLVTYYGLSPSCFADLRQYDWA